MCLIMLVLDVIGGEPFYMSFLVDMGLLSLIRFLPFIQVFWSPYFNVHNDVFNS